MDVEAAKRAVGAEAAALVEDGMMLGLGTGSTARWFILGLAERVRHGLRCRAVATSQASEQLAGENGIVITELGAAGVDLAVDGADVVDPELRLIKGAGGALVRERIVAAAARRFVVVVDETKLADRLEGSVPVEIVRFGAGRTLAQLGEVGRVPFALRGVPEGPAYVTDNGNLIADGAFGTISDPEELAERLDGVPGTVGHGLFLGMADSVLVARADGSVERRESTAP